MESAECYNQDSSHAIEIDPPSSHVNQLSDGLNLAEHDESSKSETLIHSSSSGAQILQTLFMPDLQLKHVTVFVDRAQLCRTVTLNFKTGQIVEVIFAKVSSTIDKDSMRVELRGAATILDVTLLARSMVSLEENWSQGVLNLQTEFRHCQRQAETVLGRIQRLEKQRTVLDNYTDSLLRKSPTLLSRSSRNPQSHPAQPHRPIGSPNLERPLQVDAVCGQDCMETIHSFFSLYGDQAERLDKNLNDSKEELERMQDRMEQLEMELKELKRHQDDHIVRELSVLVEPRENGPVEMLITYVVNCCAWRPAYDIRLFNSDGSMKVIYYGMIQQSTGEDWKPKKLTLSTAQPASGGILPTLSLQRLHYKQSVPHRSVGTASNMAKSSRLLTFKKSTKYAASRSENGLSIPELFGHLQPGVSARDGQTVQHSLSGRKFPVNRSASRQGLASNILISSDLDAEHAATNGIGNPQLPSAVTVLFDVPRTPALIPCTNEEVRTTIGLLNLQAIYDYITVPKRSLTAFLKAYVRNTGNFYILAGPVNIYSDNTFIGKSELGNVAPGEEFVCNLGTEPGIEVSYRPLFKSRDTGSGSSQKTAMTFRQMIEVRNTFQRSVHVTVIDQLPTSGEDKIKVYLLEPTFKHPEKYEKHKPIRINKNNNIEWDIELNAGEIREISLKFCVEYPSTEEVDVILVE